MASLPWLLAVVYERMWSVDAADSQKHVSGSHHVLNIPGTLFLDHSLTESIC